MRKLIMSLLAVCAASGTAAANRPSEYITICNEGTISCSVASTTNVAFGRADQFFYKEVTGTFACTEATFGGRIGGGVNECSIPKISGSSSSSSGSSSSSTSSSSSSSGGAVTAAALGFKGFGTETTAGSGGRIIRVTNLAAEGPGSFREALEATGPRIIIFDVGGVIDLDKSNLKLVEPFVTIAGQTAPSPGITLIRGGMSIETHDVLMQHIRFRMGDAGMPKMSGYHNDVTTSGPNAYNVIIDHCSFAWGTDENLSVSGPRYDGPEGTSHRVTLSNNIVAEGLHDSSHEKGPHSMGTLIHDNVTDVAVIGSLYAHNNERSPWYKGGATGVIVNNVIYNPGIWSIRMGPVVKEWAGRTLPPNPRVAVVGNIMHHGVNTKVGLGLVGSNSTGGDVFMSDNLAFDRDGLAVPQTFGVGITQLPTPPVWPDGLRSRPVSSVMKHVLKHAGARPRDRDAVDKRIVSTVEQRTGAFVNSQEEVGGYPQPVMTHRVLTVPPRRVDEWLQKLAKDLE